MTAKSGAARAPRPLLVRDTKSFARRWPGKVAVGVVLVAIPTALAFWTIRRGTFIDNSWMALLAVAALALVYSVSRRLIVTVLATALIIAAVAMAITPRLSADRHGDGRLLTALGSQDGSGKLADYRDLAIGTIDLSLARGLRVAGLGADADTRMEVGSLTKAMTGLIVADSVDRGELKMDVPISTYLPSLAGFAAGMVSMRQLVTHTAGYVEFGNDTRFRAFWHAPLGRNFFATDLGQLTREARDSELLTGGTYSYSTLGAAIAGQVVAAASGMTYSDLMQTRLFDPLGMTDTSIEVQGNEVAGGWSKSGIPVQPWVMGSYAPGGGAISTVRDLAKLATALLNGTAPGMDALTPTTPTSQPDTRIGVFWHTSTTPTGETLTWHNGQTGGYTSYFAIDRTTQTAVIVLSDVSNTDVRRLGMDLLADLT